MKIFLNSIPKSGTHLFSSVLDELDYKRVNWFLAPSLIYSNHRYLKELLRKSTVDENNLKVGLDVQVGISRKYIKRKLRAVRDNEYILGHTVLDDWLLKELKNSGFEIISIIRDPADVLNSNIHHLQNRKDHFLFDLVHNWDFSRIADLYIQGGKIGSYTINPMYVYFNSFLLTSSETHILDFADIVNNSQRFEQMVSMLNRNNVQIIKENYWGKGNTFRSGHIGSGRSSLSQKQINRLKNEINYTFNCNY